MIKSSKSISALLFLFLCFFASSRYLQKIKYDGDLLNSSLFQLSSKQKSCLPKEDSLIHLYENNDIKSLIIIIDAFPNNVIFKNITGYDSKLHNYLKENSSENFLGFGITQKTWTSLPYLLAKIHPDSGCRYPFLRGVFKPRLLLNDELIGSNEGICPKVEQYVSRNAFKRYSNRLKAKM